MFERPHHRRIAQVLEALDGDRLRALGCLFGGGTAIALRYGEYRESVGIDFLVSDPAGYRRLRELLAGANALAVLQRADVKPLELARDIRGDQYGIRTVLLVDAVRIKFEIVFEARIDLARPGRNDDICGVATLVPTDLAASKLLANCDRWRDDSVFSRDVIDLAMMGLPPRALQPAMLKAASAYGDAVLASLRHALDGLDARPSYLQRCLAAMAMELPPAALQQRLRTLRRRVERVALARPRGLP